MASISGFASQTRSKYRPIVSPISGYALIPLTYDAIMLGYLL